jgi:hypothetical protein
MQELENYAEFILPLVLKTLMKRATKDKIDYKPMKAFCF